MAAALAINFPARVLEEVCATPLLHTAATLIPALHGAVARPGPPPFVEQRVPGLQLVQQVMLQHLPL